MVKLRVLPTRLRVFVGVTLALLVIASCAWFWPQPATADSEPDFRANEILVRLNSTSGATIDDINASYGTTTLGQSAQPPGAYRLGVPAGQDARVLVVTMAVDSRLLYAQLNYLHEPPEADPRRIAAWGGFDAAPYNSQATLTKLGLAQAQAISQGEGVIVAVIDTGVQLDHPVLAGSLTTIGKDFVDNDNVPNDDFDGLDNDGDGLIDEAAGHGTHIAGIIHLVAPKAKIMPLRVLDSDGHGDEFSVGKAIEFAKEHGASIINLSLGSLYRSKFIEEEIKDATESGILVVAAAGNLNVPDPQYPAGGACALAVASVGANDVKSDFSNYGAYVDVSAPGENIYSTFPISGFATWSGTSMATPLVAGQAALIRSKYPSLNPRQVAIWIAGTADVVDGLNLPFLGLLGHGRINIAASLDKLALGVLPVIGDIISTNCEEGDSRTATPGPQTPTPTSTNIATPQTPAPTPSATLVPVEAAVPYLLVASVSKMPSPALTGGWVIGGVSYQADGNTQFDTTHGAFANEACLGATYSDSASVLLLSRLETLESYKCKKMESGTPVPLFQNFGVIESRPANVSTGMNANASENNSSSAWRVGAISYTTNSNTAMMVTHGPLSVGAFVELQYRVVSGERVATQIQTHVAPGQGPLSTAGKLVTRPTDDWGTWVIGGIPYVGDHAIQVDLAGTVGASPEWADASDARRLVWVNYYESNNQRYATWVREMPLQLFLPLARK